MTSIKARNVKEPLLFYQLHSTKGLMMRQTKSDKVRCNYYEVDLDFDNVHSSFSILKSENVELKHP